MKALNYIDIFGQTFSFTVKNNAKYTTKFGGVSSVICLIMVLAFSFFFGSDFYFRKNPRVLSQSGVPESDTIIRVRNHNFTIAFRLVDIYKETRELKRVKPELLYYQYVFNSTLNKTVKNITGMKYVRCDDPTKKFDPSFMKTKGIVPKIWYCVDWEGYDYKMGGSSGSPEFYYMGIGYVTCDSSGCYNYTEAKSEVGISTNKIFFNMVYPLYYFSPHNYDQPLNSYYSVFSNQLSVNLVKTDSLNYKSVYFDDDRGWILSNTTSSEIIAFDTFTTDYYFRTDSDVKNVISYQEFYNMRVYFTKKFDKFSRSYMKFQELCAIVGGFMKIVITLLTEINHYLYKFSIDIFFIKELFDFSGTEIKNKDHCTSKIFDNFQNKNTDNSAVNLNENSKLKTINNVGKLELMTENNYVNAEKNINQQPRKKSVFTLSKVPVDSKNLILLRMGNKNKNFITWDFIIHLITCRKCFISDESKRKAEFYNISKDYVKEKFDVISYIKLSEQVERLKILLLNYYQNLCLQYIKKPNLLDEEEMKRINFSFKEKFDESKKNSSKLEVAAYYMQRLEQNKLDDYDRSLFDMIDPSLKLLVENQLKQKIS